MSIFDCCGEYTVDHTEGSAVSTISKIKQTKNKNLILLNSPKASLKSLTSLKNFKNNENLNKSKEILLASTVDVANEQSPFKIKKGYSGESARRATIQHSPSFLYVEAIQVEPMVKSNHVILNDKVDGTDILKTEKKLQSAVKNQGNKCEEKILGNNKIELIKENLETVDNEFHETKEKNSENRFSFHSNIKVVPKKQFGRVKMPSSKMKLGGSKFTILSEGELEEILNDDEPRLEESAIILNVFKATESQVGKWEAQAKINNY